MVPLLGVVIVFCLHGVGELVFMAVFMKSSCTEVVVDYWRLICDVDNKSMLF